MAPVVQAIAARPGCRVSVVATAQHRQMLDQALQTFRIAPDFDLDIMRPGQSLTDTTTAVLRGVESAIEQAKPNVVLVHGDTTTSFSAALAAFYGGLPVGHVEAGLRTGNRQSPWPEETNRVLTAQLTDLHFAPTEQARSNLLAESIADDSIVVTGNTVIDALQWTLQTYGNETSTALRTRFPFLGSDRLILVTGHRRESFDGGIARMCSALVQLAQLPDVQIIYPVHPNPIVQQAVTAIAGDDPSIHLIEPLGYVDFVALMAEAHLIVSDSGGVQEEAPFLHVPVLVTREHTERPEAVDVGAAKLVGTNTDQIVEHAQNLLSDSDAYAQMATAGSPFGDGRASKRIVDALVATYGE